MALTDILFNAVSGGVLGSALHVVTDYFDTKNKVSLMNAQVAAAEKTEAWKATQRRCSLMAKRWNCTCRRYLMRSDILPRQKMTWATIDHVFI
jgi:hypothetical protein